MLKQAVLLLVLASACAVSSPSLLACDAGQAAVSLADGGWSCQAVALESEVVALQQQLAMFVKNDGGLPPAITQLQSQVASLQTSSVTQTTGPLTLWVRTDGDDSKCNGQKDAASGSAPNCAVASLQRAIDLVPAYVAHTVTITLGSGIFQAPANVQTLAQIAKVGRPDTGSITIVGSSAGTTLSSPGGSTQVLFGISVASGRLPVTLQNLTLTGFATAGVTATSATVTLTNVTSQNMGVWGLLCSSGATCVVNQASSFNNNFVGMRTAYGARLEIGAEAEVNVNNNLSNGLEIDEGSALVCYGNLTVNSNSASGLLAIHGASAYFQNGNVSLSGNGGGAMYAENAGMIYLNTPGVVTIDVPAGGGPGIEAFGGSLVTIQAADMRSIGITCDSGTSSVGIQCSNQSSIVMQGSGSISITHCSHGISVDRLCDVEDLGPGSRSDSSGSEYVNNGSVYANGGFPAATCGAEPELFCQ